MQAGLAVTNLIPRISGLTTVYEPLSDSEAYTRTGLYMLDVPRISVSGGRYAVSLEGYRRSEDAAEIYAWKNLDKTEALSFDNSYIKGMNSVLGEDSRLEYVRDDNWYYADLNLNLDEEDILRFTPDGWTFQGSALRVNGTSQEYEENPVGNVSAIIKMGEMTGPEPGNGTSLSLRDKLATCEECGWWDKHWKWAMPVTLVGGVVVGWASFKPLAIVVLKFGRFVLKKLGRGGTLSRTISETESLINPKD